MGFQLIRFDHIQLAIPMGMEDTARRFYGQILGFREMEKPESLKKRGGAWFSYGEVNLHLGVEAPFVPQKKGHPALQVKNIFELMKHLDTQQVDYQQDDLLPGAYRFYVFDPFGNRLEFLEWQSK